MTVEEAYLLASYLKSIAADVTLAMGPVRVEGRDDQFPKDIKGNVVEPVKFTIRREVPEPCWCRGRAKPFCG